MCIPMTMILSEEQKEAIRKRSEEAKKAAAACPVDPQDRVGCDSCQ